MNGDFKETNGKLAKAYTEYAKTLEGYCCQRTSSPDDAKEIVHDAFIKAHDYLANGNEVQDMNGFLFRIANNLIVDRSRKDKGRNGKQVSIESLADSGVFPESSYGKEMVDRKLDAEKIIGEISKAEKKDVLLFLLRYMDGLSVPEISMVTGLKQSNVSVRLHRMIKKAGLKHRS